MGNDNSKQPPSCDTYISDTVPLCNNPRSVDWIGKLKATEPCKVLDTFLGEPDECVGRGGCPLHYDLKHDCNGGSVCTKQHPSQVPHFKGVELNDNVRKMLCCSSEFDKSKCESKYCGSGGSGCPGLMQNECSVISKDYPKSRDSSSKVNIDFSKVNIKTDKNKYIFMYQDYPLCGCYDQDAQAFESKRRGVKVSGNGGDTELTVAMSVPPSCWFGPCRNPYIFGNTPSCSQSISVCLQENDIEYGDGSSGNKANLRNDCSASAGGSGNSPSDDDDESENGDVNYTLLFLLIIAAVIFSMCSSAIIAFS